MYHLFARILLLQHIIYPPLCNIIKVQMKLILLFCDIGANGGNDNDSTTTFVGTEDVGVAFVFRLRLPPLPT